MTKRSLTFQILPLRVHSYSESESHDGEPLKHVQNPGNAGLQKLAGNCPIGIPLCLCYDNGNTVVIVLCYL